MHHTGTWSMQAKLKGGGSYDGPAIGGGGYIEQISLSGAHLAKIAAHHETFHGATENCIHPGMSVALSQHRPPMPLIRTALVC